ncbi:MAG: DUF116 domain-containing protein [Candidatus Scalindua sp.]|nr:DUF116 domain-containing protein [Candidatus Scalindua sp.]
MEVIDKKFVSLNNLMTRLRKKKSPPEGLLLLFPHCIQNSKCKQNIKHDVNECVRCGKCKVMDLLALSEEYGISIAVASGGRIALKRVMAKEVQGVVAIACEKELRTGLMAAMPKAIYAVPNKRPYGYCIDTDVYMDDVIKAIKFFVKDYEKNSNKPAAKKKSVAKKKTVAKKKPAAKKETVAKKKPAAKKKAVAKKKPAVKRKAVAKKKPKSLL